ncbi:hypothetical protein L596_026807 [Steinernema carpocapsae]|uniref:Uncharacterized protein n=1 Tax=Steinernema carpocapsae TaxID=34508 RepID=A0A4V5ZYA2_STECR|nr:hypothetical protein L596_026807 [Steinernema carpocapsae]
MPMTPITRCSVFKCSSIFALHCSLEYCPLVCVLCKTHEAVLSWDCMTNVVFSNPIIENGLLVFCNLPVLFKCSYLCTALWSQIMPYSTCFIYDT